MVVFVNLILFITAKEFLVKAFDDTFSQTVYSRMSYVSSDFVWNAKFESSIKQEGGQMMIDLGNLNNYTKEKG